MSTVPADPLLGTWSLIGTERELIPSGEVTNTLRPGTRGFLHYLPGGRMAVVITEGGRQAPAGDVATDAEAAALFRTLMAYAGRYTWQGDQVLHHIETSSLESWTGQTQTRRVEIDGTQLRLSTLPSRDPHTGAHSVRRILWERLG